MHDTGLPALVICYFRCIAECLISSLGGHGVDRENLLFSFRTSGIDWIPFCQGDLGRNIHRNECYGHALSMEGGRQKQNLKK